MSAPKRTFSSTNPFASAAGLQTQPQPQQQTFPPSNAGNSQQRPGASQPSGGGYPGSYGTQPGYGQPPQHVNRQPSFTQSAPSGPPKLPSRQRNASSAPSPSYPSRADGSSPVSNISHTPNYTTQQCSTESASNPTNQYPGQAYGTQQQSAYKPPPGGRVIATHQPAAQQPRASSAPIVRAPAPEQAPSRAPAQPLQPACARAPEPPAEAMASLSESKEFIPLRASQSPIYPDASAWADLDRFATSAPPTNNLHSIVDYLLTRAPRQLSAAESVRVLFAWICQSIKIDKTLGKDCTFEHPSFEQRLSPETVLTEKQANSIAFAKLFAEAARLAGFDCMIIKGRRRYTNYMYPIPTNHVWNAVGIDGQWHLVDCMLGACDAILDDPVYNPNYCLMPADLFVLNHFPDEPGWQLLETPISKTQWMSYPVFFSGMFSSQINRYYAPIVPRFEIGQTYTIRVKTNNTIVNMSRKEKESPDRIHPIGGGVCEGRITFTATDLLLFHYTPGGKAMTIFWGYDHTVSIESLYGPPKIPAPLKGDEARSDRKGLDNIAKNIAHEYTTSMSSVANYLASQGRTELERGRAIYYWVATNINYDWPTFKSLGDTSTLESMDKVASQAASKLAVADEVFKRRLGMCSGFANLYAAMCTLVGIKVWVIRGTAAAVNLRGPHAWNCVQLDGQLYLVDSCWSSGCNDPETGCPRMPFDPKWWGMEPNTFLNSHLPEDPDWQLIDNPITEAEFDARPKSSESFPGLSLGEFSKHFGQLGATLHSASKSVAKTFKNLFK